MHDSRVTFALDLIALIALGLAVSIYFLNRRNNIQMGTKVKIYGTRKYRVILRYPDKEKFRLFDTSQLETLEYWLDKLVSHIVLHNMYQYYPTREMVQSWLDDYYFNLECLFDEYKGLNKGTVERSRYDEAAAFFAKRNGKLINKMRVLNAEVVTEINEIEKYLDESDTDIED